jgi:HAD superfamily hydrolase (TIGR01509 family)
MIGVGMFKAVIFDWDGTLANTRKAVVHSFQKVLRSAGCGISNEFIERRMGIGTKKTIEEALEECNLNFDDNMVEKLAKEKIRIQANCTNIVDLFDGVTELLKTLQGKIKIALATMSSKKVVDKLLPEKRIEEYFDAVVTADEIVKSKPDPEIFIVSSAKVRVKPEECVVVEDSIFGIRAAKAAKMQCIAVPSGAYSKEELEKENPDMILNSLVETERILSFIFNIQK